MWLLCGYMNIIRVYLLFHMVGQQISFQWDIMSFPGKERNVVNFLPLHGSVLPCWVEMSLKPYENGKGSWVWTSEFCPFLFLTHFFWSSMWNNEGRGIQQWCHWTPRDLVLMMLTLNRGIHSRSWVSFLTFWPWSYSGTDALGAIAVWGAQITA